jgi:hypothetical protein
MGVQVRLHGRDDFRRQRCTRIEIGVDVRHGRD